VASEKYPAGQQAKTEYITLAPGESAKTSAYFTSRSVGTHRVVVTVYDAEANYASSDIAESASGSHLASATAKVLVREKPPSPPQSTVVLKLSQGWNMVSTPSGAALSLSDIASKCDIAQNAWAYSPSSNAYEQATSLSIGTGYWLKANRDCAYEVSAPYVSQVSKQLSAGWNMVGAPGANVALTDFLGDCKVTSGPWYYSASENQYAYASAMEPGKAYWFKVASACTIGNGAAMPPAPPSS
jgi:hypothetical protein